MTAQAIRVIAHRGAKHACPENTRVAFDQALREQADGIELDVQLTRDGVPVVFHDHTLRKLGRPRQRLYELTLAQLRELDFGGWFGKSFSGEPIPALAEVLENYGHRTELCLELKPVRDPERNTELVRETLRLVRAAGVGNKVQILCFDTKLLKAAYAQAPELRYVLNALGSESALEVAAHMPWLYGIDVDIRWLTSEVGTKLRYGGRELMSYTCNTEKQFRTAAAAGVQAVITNYPAKARALLNR